MIRRIAFFLLCMMLLFSVGGIYAMWSYAQRSSLPDRRLISVDLDQFTYDQEAMPDGEVSLLQRLGDVLNREYTSDTITDSRDYLLNETIRVEWSPGAPPYVGSMDPEYQTQIRALFGDIIDTAGVSFILKNEDLNGDQQNEIAMYSTSDPLDWDGAHQGIVGVYLTVFTPIVDDQGNTLRYEMLCNSIHGYCPEVNYHSSDTRPSFSTDHWVDELSYWHHEEPYLRPLPVEARYDYKNYHSHNYQYEGAPYIGAGWIEWTGRTAEEVLAEIFASME